MTREAPLLVMHNLPPDALVDAHVHTLASDGMLTLRQLANLAKRSGLSAFVPCDHDVVHDAADLEDAGKSANVLALSGVELTTSFGDRTLHLLGYGFDLADATLLDACRRRQEIRRKRFMAMADALRRRSIKLDPRKLERILACKAPGRRHLARELVADRAAPSIRIAFQRFLNGVDYGFVDDDPLPIASAISILHAAGGKAVLAHPPANLLVDEWRALVDSALDGIEGDYPSLVKSHRRFLQERGAEYGLQTTAGSDYHGDEPRDCLGGKTMTWKSWKALINHT